MTAEISAEKAIEIIYSKNDKTKIIEGVKKELCRLIDVELNKLAREVESLIAIDIADSGFYVDMSTLSTLGFGDVSDNNVEDAIQSVLSLYPQLTRCMSIYSGSCRFGFKQHEDGL